MFETRPQPSTLRQAGRLLEVIFHTTVRKVRETHGNAVWALVLSILQTVLFVAVFYFMFTVMGTRGMAIRGNFLLYLLTGIFLYLTHIKTLSAVFGSEASTSAMMLHAPMNTFVAICAAALSQLYLQTLALAIILFAIHVLDDALVIPDPAGAIAMYLLAWLSGAAVGLVFLALKPWMPDAMTMVQSVYTRANMIASGKMFVANMLPGYMVVWFSWNPLFHLIDQARGYTFANYFPHWTNWQYPLYLSIALIVLGMMGEFWTRKHASASWNATR